MYIYIYTYRHYIHTYTCTYAGRWLEQQNKALGLLDRICDGHTGVYALHWGGISLWCTHFRPSQYGLFSTSSPSQASCIINCGIQSAILQSHVPRSLFLSLWHRKTWAVSGLQVANPVFGLVIPKAGSLHHSFGSFCISHQTSARTHIWFKFQGYQWNQCTKCENRVQVFNRALAACSCDL